MNEYEVKLFRSYNATQTEGDLVITKGGKAVFACKTVELPWKNNMTSISCIPEGNYILKKRHSQKYANHLIILTERGLQPFPRKWVLIHPANFFYQLRGCIAPGVRHVDIDGDGNMDVSSSKKTMAEIMAILPDETPFTIEKAA